jgi:hypothetical protein
MYGLNTTQTCDLIEVIGPQRTVMVRGHIGSGKSSTIKTLGERLPDHQCVYFDCTTKVDSGDLQFPTINTQDEANKYVEYVLHEELGLQYNKPIILMFDEWGKGNHSVQLATLRIMLERVIANKKLPEGSIVFCTTNLSSEGVKDLCPPHAMNRVLDVEMRKPDNMEWLTEFAVNNNIHPIVMGWVKDTPQLGQDFREIKDPDENKMIYHPKRVGGGQFASWRSVHACSDLMWVRDKLDDTTLTAGIVGAVGMEAGLDLMTRITIHDQLPSQESLRQDPDNAIVPTSASAIHMIIFRALASIDKQWITDGSLNNFVRYLRRLPRDAQNIFAMSVLHKDYSKRDVIGMASEFLKWARDNQYLAQADV